MYHRTNTCRAKTAVERYSIHRDSTYATGIRYRKRNAQKVKKMIQTDEILDEKQHVIMVYISRYYHAYVIIYRQITSIPMK